MWFSPCFHLCAESTDEEVDKLHCLNHSGSSATYSDYSPSQGSSGSSNPPANPHAHAHMHTHTHAHSHPHKHTPALPAPSKDQAPQSHWTNRYTHSIPFPQLHLPSSIKCSLCSVLSLPVFYSSSISSLIIKVREIHWHVQVCLSFLISAPFLFSPGFITISGLFHINSWGPSDEIVSLMALPFSINSEALEIKNRHQNLYKKMIL